MDEEYQALVCVIPLYSHGANIMKIPHTNLCFVRKKRARKRMDHGIFNQSKSLQRIFHDVFYTSFHYSHNIAATHPYDVKTPAGNTGFHLKKIKIFVRT